MGSRTPRPIGPRWRAIHVRAERSAHRPLEVQHLLWSSGALRFPFLARNRLSPTRRRTATVFALRRIPAAPWASPPTSRRLHERYHFLERGIASRTSFDSAAYVRFGSKADIGVECA